MMRQPIDPRHARAALFAIDPGCPRDEWVRIGCAAIAAGLSIDDVDEWSAQADNYAGARDVRATFRNASPNGGIGIATLWKAALATGWRPPSDNEPREMHPVPTVPRSRPSGPPRPRAAHLPRKCGRAYGPPRASMATSLPSVAALTACVLCRPAMSSTLQAGPWLVRWWCRWCRLLAAIRCRCSSSRHLELERS